MIWFILRIIIILLNIYGIDAYPKGQSNLDWIACAIFSTLVPISLFLWLSVIDHFQGLDFSKPYSWSAPFFPMNKYPIRFWYLISLSFGIAGSLRMIMDLVTGNESEAFGGTFFFTGIGIGIAVFVRTTII